MELFIELLKYVTINIKLSRISPKSLNSLVVCIQGFNFTKKSPLFVLSS